jgi:hypothetical protein
MTTRRSRAVVFVLGFSAIVLIVLELALGALSYGQPHLADPCTARPIGTGSGIGALVERLARGTLYGAACKLHTTREELVLSFVPVAGTRRMRWDRGTLDAALRAGLDHAAHETAGNGIAGDLLAFTLSKVFAPSVEWFLRQAR